MKTLQDLIRYIRKYSSNRDKWETILHLWQKARVLYFDQVMVQLRANPLNRFSRMDRDELEVQFKQLIINGNEILRKKILLQFDLIKIEGNYSINYFVKLTQKLIMRKAKEAKSKLKKDSLKRGNMNKTIRQIRIGRRLANTGLKIVANNLDYAKWNVEGIFKAGPEGILRVTSTDIDVQLPVMISLNIFSMKNIGAFSLIPFVFSFKPQINGDLYLEISHFQDGKNVPTIEHLTSDNIYYNAFHSEEYESPRSAILESPDYKDIFANETLKSKHADLGSPKRRIDYHSLSVLTDTSPRSGSKDDIDSPTFSTTDYADTMLILLVTSPRITFMVDSKFEYPHGAQMFTLAAGPKKEGWLPFGHFSQHEAGDQHQRIAGDSDDDSSEDEDSSDELDGDISDENDNSKSSDDESVMDSQKAEGNAGCPVQIHTAPGIKVVIKIPKLDVYVPIPGMLRFILGHFMDKNLLLAYLESIYYLQIPMEYLNFVELIINKASKYLLLPDIDATFRVHGEIENVNRNIHVRVSTPNSGLDEEAEIAGRVKAELYIQDVLNDILDVWHAGAQLI